MNEEEKKKVAEEVLSDCSTLLETEPIDFSPHFDETTELFFKKGPVAAGLSVGEHKPINDIDELCGGPCC